MATARVFVSDDNPILDRVKATPEYWCFEVAAEASSSDCAVLLDRHIFRDHIAGRAGFPRYTKVCEKSHEVPRRHSSDVPRAFPRFVSKAAPATSGEWGTAISRLKGPLGCSPSSTVV